MSELSNRKQKRTEISLNSFNNQIMPINVLLSHKNEDEIVATLFKDKISTQLVSKAYTVREMLLLGYTIKCA